MKNHIISVAIALTMLLALGGCNFINKDKGTDSFSDWTLEQFLQPPFPVEVATDNTLSNTPADIRNLVSDFDIDIRNSAYLILQNTKNDKTYAKVSGKQSEYLFFMVGMVYSIYNDPGVANAMATDYNDCIKSVGIEGLKKVKGVNAVICGGRPGKTVCSNAFSQVLPCKTASMNGLDPSFFAWSTAWTTAGEHT